MTYFGLLVVAALSLSAAMPAAAMARGQHHHHYAYSRAYQAYGFDRGYSSHSNVSADFDRRNTFN